jgi:hypothetical protein
MLSVVLAGVPCSAGIAWGRLLGNGFLDGKLYDIDPDTGAATNPRNLGIGWAIAGR